MDIVVKTLVKGHRSVARDTLRVLAAGSLSFVLHACSGNSSDAPSRIAPLSGEIAPGVEEDGIALLGAVDVREIAGLSIPSAEFARPNQPIAADELRAAYFGEADACARRGDRLAEGLGSPLGTIAGIPATFIRAGEVVTIRSPAGSVAELVSAGAGLPFYASTVEPEALPHPLPDALLVDVPEGDFPAFSGIPVPPIQPLVILEDDSVVMRYRWEAGRDANAFVRVRVGGRSASSPDVFVELVCHARDDGEFTVPVESAARLAPADRTTTEFRRLVADVHRNGDAALLVIRTFQPADF